MTQGFSNTFPTAGPTSHATPHHGIMHNLLSDAINTAKGIPFGMVQMVEHPVRSVELMGHSYADTYGHGWKHFTQTFMAHPLQPLLDAISVPLLLAGGAGAAVKGASFAAELGRGADAAALLARSSKAAALHNFAEADTLRAAAMRHPGLDRLAQYSRKGTSATTRMVPVKSTGNVMHLPQAYSSNLFRRGLTQGSQAIMEGLGNLKPGSYFSTEHLGERMLAKYTKGKLPAATAAAAKGEANVLYAAGKLNKAGKAGFDPHTVINVLGDHLEHALKQGAMPVDVAHARDLTRSPGFKEHFQFIYERPASGAFIEHNTGFTVSPSGVAERTPNVAHPAQEAGVATRSLSLGGYEHDQLMHAIKTLGARVVTGGKASKALVQDGKVFVVRKGIGEAAMQDMEKSADLMHKIYHTPLSVWKGFILGLSPRYLVNNVIGNAGMFAAATNPVEFGRGVITAVKAVRGLRAAAKVQKGMEVTLDDLMRKFMPDEWVHARFGYLQHGALGIDQTAGIRLRSPVRRAAHARLYNITEQAAYRGPQRASLMGALHTDGDFRNLYRHNIQTGMERGAAYRDAANTIISDPRKAAAFEKRVTDWAGQYYHLNSLEKKVTAFVPFYTWDRHALRFGKEQVLSRPVRSVTLAHLGALGDKQASKEMGKVPDFMKGAIPVSGHGAGLLGLLLGQNIAGRKKILLTSGYNPLASAADDAGAIAALFGQGPRSAKEAVGGQLNPIITGAISGVTGQRLFSGAKAQTHGLGPVGGVIEEAGLQLPHVKLFKQAALGQKPKNTTSKGAPTLYEKGMRQTISSLLGLNERDFSPQAAEKLYNKEQGIKKGRRQGRKAALALKANIKPKLKANF